MKYPLYSFAKRVDTVAVNSVQLLKDGHVTLWRRVLLGSVATL
jgi:hypothetical protein